MLIFMTSHLIIILLVLCWEENVFNLVFQLLLFQFFESFLWQALVDRKNSGKLQRKAFLLISMADRLQERVNAWLAISKPFQQKTTLIKWNAISTQRKVNSIFSVDSVMLYFDAIMTFSYCLRWIKCTRSCSRLTLTKS